MRNGATKNGIYTITDTSGNSFPVYCDLTSEPRSAWTLIYSFARKNGGLPAFSTKSFTSNIVVDENSPNWQAYRLSLSRMGHLSLVSTHVRATTGFDEYGVDFRDYFRMKTSSLDILSTATLNGDCKTAEFINIRGFAFTNIGVPFWHDTTKWNYHIGSSTDMCGLKTSVGSVSSEDAFNFYAQYNLNFRGAKTQESTTQWWYGGYLL